MGLRVLDLEPSALSPTLSTEDGEVVRRLDDWESDVPWLVFRFSKACAHAQFFVWAGGAGVRVSGLGLLRLGLGLTVYQLAGGVVLGGGGGGGGALKAWKVWGSYTAV